MERIKRQERTLELMVRLYCRNIHGATEGLCADCLELLDYALKRLRNCRFQPAKPVCNKCPSPCYGTEKRQQIIQIMRYSGPRMLLAHPFLALNYLRDKLMG